MLFAALCWGAILDRRISVSNNWFVYGACMDGIDVKMNVHYMIVPPDTVPDLLYGHWAFFVKYSSKRYLNTFIRSYI